MKNLNKYKVGDYVNYDSEFGSFECQIVFWDKEDKLKPYLVVFLPEQKDFPYHQFCEVNNMDDDIERYNSNGITQEDLARLKEEHKGKYFEWPIIQLLTPIANPGVYTLDYIINILYHELK